MSARTDGKTDSFSDAYIEELLVRGGGPRLIANRLKKVKAELARFHGKSSGEK